MVVCNPAGDEGHGGSQVVRFGGGRRPRPRRRHGAQLGEVEGAAQRPGVSRSPTIRLSSSGLSRPAARAWPSTAKASEGAAARIAPGRPASAVVARCSSAGSAIRAATPPAANGRQRGRAGGPSSGDEAGMRRVEPANRGGARRRAAAAGYSDAQSAASRPPLRVRVEGVAHGAAQQDPDPRDRVRVVAAEPEHEPARQAHHADQAERGADAELGDRPEVGDDLRDPALPAAARRRAARPGAAARRACSTGRSDSTRDSSAAAWWPTSWTSEEAMPWPTMRSRGTRMIATGFCSAAGQPRAGPPDGGARAAPR